MGKKPEQKELLSEKELLSQLTRLDNQQLCGLMRQLNRQRKRNPLIRKASSTKDDINRSAIRSAILTELQMDEFEFLGESVAWCRSLKNTGEKFKKELDIITERGIGQSDEEQQLMFWEAISETKAMMEKGLKKLG